MENMTAVEWLENELNDILGPIKNEYSILISKAIEQAKQMEREQIENAYGDGLNAHRTDFCNRHEYYTETFKK